MCHKRMAVKTDFYALLLMTFNFDLAIEMRGYSTKYSFHQCFTYEDYLFTYLLVIFLFLLSIDYQCVIYVRICSFCKEKNFLK